MLSMRAVTLLSLSFCLVSLMPAEKHLLIETGDDLDKGEADQNKAWGGGWPSAGFFEASHCSKIWKMQFGTFKGGINSLTHIALFFHFLITVHGSV